ncbi:MAG: dihydroorotate dehydrogenase-like protein [Chlorobi bacterium]|nr:dihydroorotate dehydrogenase-like protein [Chlorobiota bacterium]
MADLTTKYLGLTLRNPLVVASSGLTDSVDKIVDLEKNGAAAVVLKSLFEEQIALEADHKIKQAEKNDLIYSDYSETLDYIDSHIKEKELSNYIDLIKQAKSKVDIPVIASINAITNSEWTGFAKQLQDAGADALELNIFVMPFSFDRESGENESVYYSVLRKVKEAVAIPVAVKISPYFSNLGKVIYSLENNGADAIVMFNKFSSPDIDIARQKLIHADVFSQPGDIYNSLRWVSLAAKRLQIDIAATTGIHDGEAVIKQLLAGATITQMATTIYKNGPEVLTKILNFIHGWMEEKAFNYIDQFRGKLSMSAAENPEVYERVQFMKYFSEIK